MKHTDLILQQDLTPSPTHDDRAHAMPHNFEVLYGAPQPRTEAQNRVFFATMMEAWKSWE